MMVVWPDAIQIVLFSGPVTLNTPPLLQTTVNYRQRLEMSEVCCVSVQWLFQYCLVTRHGDDRGEKQVKERQITCQGAADTCQGRLI